mgnify:CR=1 FL=1
MRLLDGEMMSWYGSRAIEGVRGVFRTAVTNAVAVFRAPGGHAHHAS